MKCHERDGGGQEDEATAVVDWGILADESVETRVAQEA